MTRSTMVRATRLGVVASLLFTRLAPAGAADAARINGSGSCLDMMKPLLEAYAASHPGVSFDVKPPLGSSGSMKALLAGAIDLAVLGRAVLPEEEAKGAQGVTYGRTPLLIVTHRSVPLDDVTTAELEQIYSGRKTTWPGGEAIRVVLRPMNETNTKVMLSLSPRMAEADAAARRQPWALVAVTDPEANEMVARTPGAIGAAALTSLLVERLPLRSVSLDGVPGTAETVARGTYPLAKEIVFATTARTSAEARAIVEFAFSPEGRAIAAGTGVVAAKGAGRVR